MDEPLQHNDSAILWFAHPSNLGLDYITSPLLVPILLGSFFMSLVVGDLWNEPGKVHPGRFQFWFFQLMVVLQIVVILMCS